VAKVRGARDAHAFPFDGKEAVDASGDCLGKGGEDVARECQESQREQLLFTPYD